MQRQDVAICPVCGQTFSILGRIERDATTVASPFPPDSPDELSVSSDGSNGMQLRWEPWLSRRESPLSVSSDGSNGMQLQPGRANGRRCLTFSILGRIERDATDWDGRSAVPPGCLSVSSDGSNGMQLAGPGGHGPGGLAFQYPRTDRTGCN